MREAQLDDRAILDANMICGYFAFVNRLADGLGVPLEDYWQDEPDP
jgi:alkylhydroperoxidase family enzyme